MCRFCGTTVPRVEEMSLIVKYGGGLVVVMFLLAVAITVVGSVGSVVGSVVDVVESLVVTRQ